MSARVFEANKSILVWLDRRPVLVVKDGKNLYGMDAVCAHVGCALLSLVEGKTAVCPAHGAKYDVETGALAEPPRVKPELPCEQEELRIPLKTYAVTVDAEGLLDLKPRA